MKKKTVIISTIIVLAVLLVGGYMLFDNIFPKAKPIEKLEFNKLESVALSDNENNEITISDTELQKLIVSINDAEATRTMSVNDYPVVRPYYVLEIKTSERVFRYMIYEDNGVVYAELPYEGVYRIDSEIMEFVR